MTMMMRMMKKSRNSPKFQIAGANVTAKLASRQRRRFAVNLLQLVFKNRLFGMAAKHAGFSLLHNHSSVDIHQQVTFCQLQCELVQRPVGWKFSLSDFNVVECLSQ